MTRTKNTSSMVKMVIIGIAVLAGQISCTVPTKSVTDAVETFAKAFRAADIETLDQLLTDDYVNINAGGQPIDKEAWLRWMTSRGDELARGDYVIETYELEDLEIVLYGQAAVVTGMVHSSGTSYKQPFNSKIRFTNLWVHEGGRWRRAAFHDSPAK